LFQHQRRPPRPHGDIRAIADQNSARGSAQSTNEAIESEEAKAATGEIGLGQQLTVHWLRREATSRISGSQLNTVTF
jgi:hypothetical protein